jgi:hypothetical protein
VLPIQQPSLHALLSWSQCCETYHTQYMLLTRADYLLCLQLHPVGSQFFHKVFIWLALILFVEVSDTYLHKISPSSNYWPNCYFQEYDVGCKYCVGWRES